MPKDTLKTLRKCLNDAQVFIESHRDAPSFHRRPKTHQVILETHKDSPECPKDALKLLQRHTKDASKTSQVFIETHKDAQVFKAALKMPVWASLDHPLLLTIISTM